MAKTSIEPLKPNKLKPPAGTGFIFYFLMIAFLAFATAVVLSNAAVTYVEENPALSFVRLCPANAVDYYYKKLDVIWLPSRSIRAMFLPGIVSGALFALMFIIRQAALFKVKRGAKEEKK